MKEPGFPIDSQGNISVSTTYVHSKVENWTWNYKYKSYVLDLKDDLILTNDDPQLNIANLFKKHEVQTQDGDTISFIIFLNGHHMDVATFTIPKGVTLYIINGSSTSGKESGSVSTIKLANSSGKTTYYGF